MYLVLVMLFSPYTNTVCNLQINVPKRFLNMGNFSFALTVLAFSGVGYAQTVGPFNQCTFPFHTSLFNVKC
jgi:hypothetical protein